MADPNLDVRPRVRDLSGLHLIFAVIVTIAGLLLMLTGALMQVGVAVFVLGLIYATISIIFFRMNAGHAGPGHAADR